MSVAVALRPSADKSNALVIGSDGGLMALPLPAGQFGSNLNTIDNSQSGAPSGTTYYYPMPAGATAAATVGGQPVAQQLLFTRNAVITAVYGNITTNTTSSPVYGSLYLPDPVTRYPGAKVTDLFTMSAAANGVVSAAMLDATTVLAGNAVYWLLTWSTAAASLPGVTCRSASPLQQARLNSVSASSVASPGISALSAGTFLGTTTGLASAVAGFPVTAPVAATAPLFYFGVRNAA